MATVRDKKKPKEAAVPETKAHDKIVVQKWMSRDSWSGPDDEGYSLHFTKKDAEAHWAEKCREERERNPSGATPEFYITRDGGPQEFPVPEAVYDLVKSRKTVWIDDSEVRTIRGGKGEVIVMYLTDNAWARLNKKTYTKQEVVDLVVLRVAASGELDDISDADLLNQAENHKVGLKDLFK